MQGLTPAVALAQRAGLGDLVAEHTRSYVDRKTGAEVLNNLPRIRVHTAIEAMMWALESSTPCSGNHRRRAAQPPGPASSRSGCR